jgi:capsule polysaccharide export protein KpsE/RkpR
MFRIIISALLFVPTIAQSQEPKAVAQSPKAVVKQQGERHEAGVLTETQRLKMANIQLAEYAIRADVRQAQSDAELAARKAGELETALPQRINNLESEKAKVKAEIEAQNPGWRWHDAQSVEDHDGLVKIAAPSATSSQTANR